MIGCSTEYFVSCCAVNVDDRYQRIFNTEEFISLWNIIIDSPNVLHWYAENKYWNNSKVSTLPIGCSMGQMSPDSLRNDISLAKVPWKSRINKIVVADKVRYDKMSRDRMEALKLCRHRQEVCANAIHTNNETILQTDDWNHRISQFRFILCTHGGGIDPSPKAWVGILLGTIPIIEFNSLYDAYKELPVAFVNNTVSFLKLSEAEIKSQLLGWENQLGKYYVYNSPEREGMLQKLQTKYWWNKFSSNIPDYKHQYNIY